MNKFVFLPVAAALLGSSQALGAPLKTPPRFDAIPCKLDNLPVGSQCGSVRVPESWSGRSARNIDLRVVRIPAQGGLGRSAIFIFQGGPGQAATKLSKFYERVYRPASKTHDIVLIDQRGTGGSNPLACDFGGSAMNPEGYFADIFDPEIIRKCRSSLESRADLTRYSTRATATDTDAVRRALGYEAIDIYGTSYGTRLAMEYARLYPRHVRTLTLKGVVAPLTIIPATFAADVEHSVELMLRDCSAEAACASKFPRLRADLNQAVAQLNAGPVVVPLDDGKKVTLTRGLFGASIRTMLQATSLRADFPRLIHQSANGNWSPYVARSMELRKAAQTEIATGLMLSVLCAEDVPLLNGAKARAAASGTVLGPYWVDQVMGACRIWPKGKVAREWRKSFRIEAPTLLISGGLDPATPPREAEDTRQHLPRSSHLIVPGGSHSFAGLSGCVDKIMSEFIISGTLDSLETKCAGQVKPPPFKS